MICLLSLIKYHAITEMYDNILKYKDIFLSEFYGPICMLQIATTGRGSGVNPLDVVFHFATCLCRMQHITSGIRRKETWGLLLPRNLTVKWEGDECPE
jgi:hypothetical protein